MVFLWVVNSAETMVDLKVEELADEKVDLMVDSTVFLRVEQTVDKKVVLSVVMLGSVPQSTSWRQHRTKCLENTNIHQ